MTTLKFLCLISLIFYCHLAQTQDLRSDKSFITASTLLSIKKSVRALIPSLIAKEKPRDLTRTYFSTTKYIFEHQLFPEYIFKLTLNPSSGLLEKQQKQREHAAHVIKLHNLTGLIIPQTQGFYLTDDESRAWAVSIEKKMRLLPKADTEDFLKSPSLVKQLTIFACQTGFYDFHYGNIPLLSDQQLLLCDLEFELPENKEETYKSIFTGLGNLLLCMPEQLHPLILQTAQATLNIWRRTLLTSLCQSLETSTQNWLSDEELEIRFVDIVRQKKLVYSLKLLGLKALAFQDAFGEKLGNYNSHGQDDIEEKLSEGALTLYNDAPESF